MNPLSLALSVAVLGSPLLSFPQASAQTLKIVQQRGTLTAPRVANVPTDAGSSYPTVDGKKWDKVGPWFRPVLVRDGTGTYTAVLDKQKQGKLRQPELTTIDQVGVFSNWSRQGIRLVGNGQVQVCLFVLCGTNYPRIAVEALEVKLGDQIFRPQRQGDTFLVDEELAQALIAATPGKALMRLHLSSGITVTHALNDETVKAWPTVFQSASLLDINLPPVGGGTLSTAKMVTVEPFPALPANTPSKTFIRDPKTSLPLINGSTWRTGRHVAWGTPVVVRDEFDGEYRAVLAKNSGLITQWSRNFVDVFLSSRFATALTFYGVPSIHITMGDRTLNLYGQNNRFYINKMAAQFLQEAGEKSLETTPTISYYVDKGRSKRTYDLDIGTVKTWASLYREN